MLCTGSQKETLALSCFLCLTRPGKNKATRFTGGSLLKEDFRNACKEAGIENFRFHDLRHVAINNWRKAGHDYFKIMKTTGHKTMAVFKRYNTVDDVEFKSLAMDTYMDISKESQEIPSHN